MLCYTGNTQSSRFRMGWKAGEWFDMMVIRGEVAIKDYKGL